MGLVAFSISNIWFALETADEEHSILDPDVLLANPTLLKTVGMSLVAILLATELDVFHRLLDTVSLTSTSGRSAWSFRSPCWSSPRDASSWASTPWSPRRQSTAAPVPVPAS